MGAFLEKPKTEKTTVSGKGCGISYGVSAMQGWRMEMEDAHVCNTSFCLKNHGFFGVFDGHAGPKVSQYCSEHLLDTILESITGDGKYKEDEVSSDVVKDGIHSGFLNLDSKLRNLPQWASGEDRSGTTAIVSMVTPDKIIWGNCGDSRGLLCRDAEVKFSTSDHKPYNIEEKRRIERAGGTVMMQRVNGSLAVSRALGDFDYKRATELPPTEQLVSPEPEITVVDRDREHDQFLLLACDGVFDVMSNDEVVAYVLHHLQLTDDLAQICSDLIDACLNKNSRDNMSVILVTFPNAPKVSQEVIEKEKKLQKEAVAAIEVQLKKRTEEAQDPLALEENYVIQSLAAELPPDYDVVGKRPFVSELLQKLRKEKFGHLPEEEEMSFSGYSDPDDAPQDFKVSVGGNEFLIQGIMAEADDQPRILESSADTKMDTSPPRSPGKEAEQGEEGTHPPESPAEVEGRDRRVEQNSTTSERNVKT